MSLAEFLNQPIILAGVAIAVVGAAAFIILIKRSGEGTPLGGGGKGKTKIIVLQPRDKRTYELPVTERELTLDAVKDKVPRKYYKAGPGYVMPNGTTLFFGIESSAYTAVLRDDKPVKMTLPETLQSLWGAKAYGDMPKALKEPLETSQWGVTLDPVKIDDGDKYPHLNVENISDEKKEKLVGYVAKAIKDEGKMDWKTMLMGAALGLVVGIMLVSFKVIRLA